MNLAAASGRKHSTGIPVPVDILNCRYFRCGDEFGGAETAIEETLESYRCLGSENAVVIVSGPADARDFPDISINLQVWWSVAFFCLLIDVLLRLHRHCCRSSSTLPVASCSIIDSIGAFCNQ